MFIRRRSESSGFRCLSESGRTICSWAKDGALKSLSTSKVDGFEGVKGGQTISREGLRRCLESPCSPRMKSYYPQLRTHSPFLGDSRHQGSASCQRSKTQLSHSGLEGPPQKRNLHKDPLSNMVLIFINLAGQPEAQGEPTILWLPPKKGYSHIHLWAYRWSQEWVLQAAAAGADAGENRPDSWLQAPSAAQMSAAGPELCALRVEGAEPVGWFRVLAAWRPKCGLTQKNIK